MSSKPIIAVLIPCYNEEQTISEVVNQFRNELPEAIIYVYDNNSSDKTAHLAREAGAVVRKESRQGKGNVVRSMFREIEADVFILVDGDETYPASSIEKLLGPVIDGKADMAVGDRLSNNSYFKKNERKFHGLGNRLVRFLINRLFGVSLKDIMSGYRVFTDEFVKNMPVMSRGFEIETEMTLHALDKRFRIIEIPIDYGTRPEGSFSKLNTFSDGTLVLKTVFNIFKNYRPLLFFSTIGMILMFLGIISGIGPIMDYAREQFVYRVPMAILATGLVISSLICFAMGIILDTVNQYHRMQYELTLNRYKENKVRILKEKEAY